MKNTFQLQSEELRAKSAVANLCSQLTAHCSDMTERGVY